MTSPWEAGQVVGSVESDLPIDFTIKDHLGRTVAGQRNSLGMGFTFRASSLGQQQLIFDNQGRDGARVTLAYTITP